MTELSKSSGGISVMDILTCSGLSICGGEGGCGGGGGDCSGGCDKPIFSAPADKFGGGGGFSFVRSTNLIDWFDRFVLTE